MSEQLVDSVLAVIPVGEPGISYAEAHRRVGMWSPVTIRKAIYELRVRGLVERRGDDRTAFFHRVAT